MTPEYYYAIVRVSHNYKRSTGSNAHCIYLIKQVIKFCKVKRNQWRRQKIFMGW